MRFRVAVQGITYHLGGGYTHLDDFVPTGDPSRQSIPSLYGGLQFRRGFVTVDVSGRYYRNRIPATLNPDILRSGFTPLSQPLYEMNDQTNEALGARVLVTPVSWLRHQTAVGIDRQALSAFQTRRRFTTPDDTLLALRSNRSRKLSFSSNATALLAPFRPISGSLTFGLDHYEWWVDVYRTTNALNSDGAIVTNPPASFERDRSRTRNTGYFAQEPGGPSPEAFLYGSAKGRGKHVVRSGLADAMAAERGTVVHPIRLDPRFSRCAVPGGAAFAPRHQARPSESPTDTLSTCPIRNWGLRSRKDGMWGWT